MLLSCCFVIKLKLPFHMLSQLNSQIHKLYNIHRSETKLYTDLATMQFIHGGHQSECQLQRLFVHAPGTISYWQHHVNTKVILLQFSCRTSHSQSWFLQVLYIQYSCNTSLLSLSCFTVQCISLQCSYMTPSAIYSVLELSHYTAVRQEPLRLHEAETTNPIIISTQGKVLQEYCIGHWLFSSCMKQRLKFVHQNTVSAPTFHMSCISCSNLTKDTYSQLVFMICITRPGIVVCKMHSHKS